MQQSWKRSLLVDWMLALPLLHFLRRESKPFEDVMSEKSVDVSNWRWWGLEEFSYREIRRNITARFALHYLYFFATVSCSIHDFNKTKFLSGRLLLHGYNV